MNANGKTKFEFWHYDVITLKLRQKAIQIRYVHHLKPEIEVQSAYSFYAAALLNFSMFF